jgi:hypothetical protein
MIVISTLETSSGCWRHERMRLELRNIELFDSLSPKRAAREPVLD